jgi:hypothetical protein
MGQSKANEWIRVLLPVLLAAGRVPCRVERTPPMFRRALYSLEFIPIKPSVARA